MLTVLRKRIALILTLPKDALGQTLTLIPITPFSEPSPDPDHGPQSCMRLPKTIPNPNHNLWLLTCGTDYSLSLLLHLYLTLTLIPNPNPNPNLCHNLALILTLPQILTRTLILARVRDPTEILRKRDRLC